MKFCICFDLGSDSLKVTYAYKDDNQNVHWGKINSDTVNQSAIAAAAYYDLETKKWIFGNDIDYGNTDSFVTVIKIKSMLMLLKKIKDSNIEQRNFDFYFNKNIFPKFYFPYNFKMDNGDDFNERIEKEMTFEAKGYTPQKVCEDYFVYVKKIINAKVKKLVKEKKLDNIEIEYSMVYAPKMGDAFVEEYERIITKVFDKPKIVISSIKAVSMYAFHKQYFTADEPILFFDMGETDISVAKAQVISNKGYNGVTIDSMDGHSSPIEIGGDDIDKEIIRYLEGTIERRETIGTPSFGDFGHIVEKGLHSKQYLLMKNVKKAKLILSQEDDFEMFRNGVPLTISRDVIVQRNFTKEELKECIGVNLNQGIARKIADYMINEIKLDVNKNVKKVIISGGIIETYGLFDYIVEEIHKKRGYKNLEIYTIETKANSDDLYPIESFEDSTFAACLGGAIVNLMDYKVRICLSLSYGSWYSGKIRIPVYASKYLNLFKNAEKGDIVNEEGQFLSMPFCGDNQATIKEEFFSINITSTQIANQYNRSKLIYANGKLLIGSERDSKANPNPYDLEEYRIRDLVKKELDLKVVAGGGNTVIRFFYKNKPVYLHGKVEFLEGVIIDKNGYCTPHICNDIGKNRGQWVSVSYYNIFSDGTDDSLNKKSELKYRDSVPATEIEPRFIGMSGFETGNNDR